ncbi:MAG: hypothetical protein EPO40_18855 [Myxococcaceae bacterium]|nr:MAG: hypothetical protein EPO40_18855 [Myxococcaceae bacterium]
MVDEFNERSGPVGEGNVMEVVDAEAVRDKAPAVDGGAAGVVEIQNEAKKSGGINELCRRRHSEESPTP